MKTSFSLSLYGWQKNRHLYSTHPLQQLGMTPKLHQARILAVLRPVELILPVLDHVCDTTRSDIASEAM